MKKLLLLTLVLILVLSLTSCGNTDNLSRPSTPENPEQKPSTISPDPPAQAPSTPSPEPAEEQYIIDFYAKLKQVIAEHDIDLNIAPPNQGRINISKDGLKAYFQYSIVFKDNDIDMRFAASKDSQLIKEIIVMVLLAFGDMDYNEARSEMQTLVNSYSTDKFSSIATAGKYAIYIMPEFSLGKDSVLVLVNPYEKYNDINRAEYQEINFATAQASEMNKGTKFYIPGNVVSDNRDKPDIESTLTYYYANVIANDGHEYKLICEYGYNLVIGDEYMFYGTLTSSGTRDLPLVRIDYITLKE